ncbi:MAG: hypothetical protein AUG49_05395 [Catenulispora sp. 13_1_20CM_3_70_7]|nr:MAG: hypothetical protein AUG49_05395 [Catenulispora sp. 13_1_20CM_3_70_7]HKN54368.1 PqqD family protein [Amycolatopsis sp.]
MNIADETYIRALNLTVRRGEDGGLLLETYFGRYTLNRDARQVWQFIDGHRPVHVVAELVAEARGEDHDAVHGPVEELCERLAELGLLERA